jgi:hypothetical protein
MGESPEKNLSDITRSEWVRYNWLEVAPTEEDRVFVQGYRRTPDEARQAAEDWDIMTEELTEEVLDES